jgi:hypothetical protein
MGLAPGTGPTGVPTSRLDAGPGLTSATRLMPSRSVTGVKGSSRPPRSVRKPGEKQIILVVDEFLAG